MPKRKILIIHGISADSRDNWYVNVGKHFSDAGHDVLIPNFPVKHAPNLNKWSNWAMAEIAKKGWTIDENLCLIGHSTGSLAVLRFTERLPAGAVIGPSILVACFPVAFLNPRFPTLVARTPRPGLITPKLPRVLAVHSTNDWRVPIAQNSAWLQKNLNAEVFTIGDAGHVITRHGWQDWSDELYEKADKFLADDDK